VKEYDRAGFYWCGKYQGEIGPGLKRKLPWFVEYIDVTVQPYPITTGRKDITLTDGEMLSFDATALVRVVDVGKALNEIDDYHHAATAIVTSVLATKLAEVDRKRLTPEGRARLLTDLRKWIDRQLLPFGLTCLDVSFNSFVQNPRTYRILTDAEMPTFLS
jgi:regulator of protease activity HflC (stomatin/prohibitin superfamily)